MATKAQRREALVRAAIDVIGERGLSGTRVADIGERAGISPGHVLYYFEGKSEIFTLALRTIEDDLRADALAAFEQRASAAERWRWLIERSAPAGPGDPRLMLWLQAWEQAPRDPDVAVVLAELERGWLGLLSEVVEYGRGTGEFRLDDAADFAVRFAALMDGLTIQVVVGLGTLDRERMLEICVRVSRAELGF